ncbi:MAG: O-methyltransferase [Lachnospiraceae bacterium]|nr:O-methyltransferase [Lachnospiraceae bacterium]
MKRFDIFSDTVYEDIDPDLLSLEKEAVSNEVPIIRKSTQRFLRWLLMAKKPENILEIGTAVGFSSILMARFLPKAHIDTIENFEPRLIEARENFKRFKEGERITLFEGDASEVLSGFDKGYKYDFVFIDAAKGQYSDYFNKIKELIFDDAVIACDNILQEGSLLDSRFAVKRRDRTIHQRMRDFLHEVADEGEYVSTLLPIGDGLLLISKGDKNE